MLTDEIIFILSGAVSYLIGSIPTGYLLVRWRKGIDIRTFGSGSTGATNVARALGKWAFLPVFAMDFAKGFLCIFFLPLIVPYWGYSLDPVPLLALQMGCGVLAIGGHLFPIFLRFRGGKGVATGAGVIVALNVWVALAALGFWFVVVLLFRYVSLASIAAVLSLPVAHLLLSETTSDAGRLLTGFYLFIAVVVVLMHRANIARIVKGSESRISWRKKS
ncbi:MAG: acyl-phosphate glycerol 3-phosphate acyltransferase [Planctomycetes bacterium RBG_16_59_8]|nr:MAG: acyl-phosphate glycerol 3-phosphate acyltransferase [Planctomycetes bacterium RBG_16_59_8]